MATTPTNKKNYKTVKVKYPLSKTEKDDIYVAVNGKSMLIKRGVYVDVPEHFAEVLETKEKMLGEAIAFEAEAASRAAELMK